MFSNLGRSKSFALSVVLGPLSLILGFMGGATLAAGDMAFALDEDQMIRLDWRVDAAKLAKASGLGSVAASAYRDLLERDFLSEEQKSEYRLDLAEILIGQGRYGEAKASLDQIGTEFGGARKQVYELVCLYVAEDEPDLVALRGRLAQIELARLSPGEVPWYHLLAGIAEDPENRERARESFERAEASSVNDYQRAFFSSLVFRQRILTVTPDEDLLPELSEKLEELSGQAVAFTFLREYVIVLHRLGRDAEAIAAIERELSSIGANYSREERAEMLLLKALILGPENEAGWSALKELVRNGFDRKSSSSAIQLLARVEGRDAEFMVFLNEIISTAEPHPILEQLYYIRCQLALSNPDTIGIAEADARHILDQYPGLDQISNVYRLLAYASLQRDPPQYRVAADFLINLREEQSVQTNRSELNRMIGDCYFLNGDFANAVDFYQAARVAAVSVEDFNRVFLRLVVAEIRSGRVDEALAFVDEADFGGEIAAIKRWRAEWNIAQALQSSGRIEMAIERINLLIGDRGVRAVPAELDMRLRWLEAYLSLESGDDSALAADLERLIARLNAFPDGALEAQESIRLRTELLLLQARTFLRDGLIEEGFAAFRQIRNGFPQTSAAERSYFSESSYHASVGDFAAARQLLINYADAHFDRKLAPQALFRAGLYSERIGEEAYAETVLLYDRLIREYPESSLVYFSGLRQGDLLRLMNDFAGAQLIYENLINSYPEHDLRYVAELSRADSVAALAKNDVAQLMEVAAILERLIDTPDLPADFQVEAGYKWGAIMQRQREAQEAKLIYGLMTGRFLLNEENALSLGAVGKYWLSRTVLDLGSLLEAEDKFDEAKRLYRKMVAFNLPGRSLAQARVDRLQLLEASGR
jgi:TolA-binding protein